MKILSKLNFVGRNMRRVHMRIHCVPLISNLYWHFGVFDMLKAHK